MTYATADGGHNIVLEIQATLPAQPGGTYRPYMRGNMTVSLLPSCLCSKSGNFWVAGNGSPHACLPCISRSFCCLNLLRFKKLILDDVKGCHYCDIVGLPTFSFQPFIFSIFLSTVFLGALPRANRSVEFTRSKVCNRHSGVYVAYAFLTWCYFGMAIAGYNAFGKHTPAKLQHEHTAVQWLA